MARYEGIFRVAEYPRIFGIFIYYLWVRQGRPRTVPVVLGVGNLVTYPDGRKTLLNWDFSTERMDEGVTIDVESLWDYLFLEYPQAHVYAPERSEE